MKKLKLTKEKISISLIIVLSAILNFANIGIEGYGNSYYAAGVKSMTMSLKNFFFVSFDPAGFVTVDKPPMGFWIQAISAKIFGFSGWSILLPQAMAGVVSVYLVYYLVKRSFGNLAGIISALCLAVTPVFVAASRNNTIDNLLVVTLLFACIALTKAAEQGKARYLYISLLLVGVGFNIKMLESYMIAPAIYITYLLSSNISFKKKIGQFIIGTFILIAVSFSWAAIVDLVPAQNRPYVGSSTNNSEMELIIGHNGLERLGLSSKSSGGPGGGGNPGGTGAPTDGNKQENANDQSMPQPPSNEDGQSGNNMQPPNGGMSGGPENQDGGPGGQGGSGTQDGGTGNGGARPGGQGGGPGGQGGLQGSFGAQVKAGLTRLFVKSVLSDQIVWFLPLALFGFIAGAIKEKLRFKLDNKRKLSLVLWFVWLAPEFIYFSYTTGLFHPYYLTMMAPPAAALAGIGISVMWEFYKEGKWKSWLLPIAFTVTGIVHMLMLSYFSSNLLTVIRNIILGSLISCFIASGILVILNIIMLIKKKNNIDLNDNIKFKKILMGIATMGILVTPLIGSGAAIIHGVSSNIPCAGLELLSNSERMSFGKENDGGNSKLIDFLKSNKTTEKYLLAVSSSQSADNIIIQSGEAVMTIGGFSGSDNILTLDQFKEMVKNGEVRYVLTGGGGPGGNNEIMNWVSQNGKVVSESEYKDNANTNSAENSNVDNPQGNTTDENNNKSSNSKKQNFRGNSSEKLYDLKDLSDTLK